MKYYSLRIRSAIFFTQILLSLTKKLFLRSSGNSEAFASELPGNLEEMFPLYYNMHRLMFDMLKSFNHTIMCYPSLEG